MPFLLVAGGSAVIHEQISSLTTPKDIAFLQLRACSNNLDSLQSRVVVIVTFFKFYGLLTEHK